MFRDKHRWIVRCRCRDHGTTERCGIFQCSECKEVRPRWVFASCKERYFAWAHDPEQGPYVFPTTGPGAAEEAEGERLRRLRERLHLRATEAMREAVGRELKGRTRSGGPR